MKTKLAMLVVWVGLCAPVLAGTLVDDANLFGTQADAVRTALADLPVWFETRPDVPAGGLKAYADQQVASVTVRGYYVVVTTHPREWRISMNPTDLASSEAIRMAGERMVSRFKAGHYANGAIQVARQLAALPAPGAMPVQPAPTPHRPPPMVRTAHASPVLSGSSITPFLVGGLMVGGFLVILAIILAVRRAAAYRMFNRHTPEQRAALLQRHAGHPQATRSVLDDPLAFWALMMAVNSSQSNAQNNSGAAPSWPTPSGLDSSSSSSPSFDSSSSSSSSDSSGAGGSW